MDIREDLLSKVEVQPNRTSPLETYVFEYPQSALAFYEMLKSEGFYSLKLNIPH